MLLPDTSDPQLKSEVFDKFSLSTHTMPASNRSSHSSRNASPLRAGFASTSSYKPDPMSVHLHPVIQAGRVALITGAASGIGRGAAIEFAK